MINIMIVDDEMLVRAGIKSLIDWNSFGFNIIGDAEDGFQALKLIEEKRPQIVLTDIVMPGMDGLALIRKMKELYPEIKIIVLSCHNEYKYVRKAMKIGAEDYLLKLSMKPEDLVNTLTEVTKTIVIDNHGVLIEEKEVQDEEFLLCLIKGEDKENDIIKKLVSKERFKWILNRKVFILIVLEDLYKKSNPKKQETAFLSILDQNLRNLKEYEVIKSGPYEFGILMEVSGDNRTIDIQDALFNMVTSSKRFLNMLLTVGISKTYTECRETNKAYKQAKEAVQYKYYSERKDIIEYKDGLLNYEKVNLFVNDEEKNLIESIESKDEGLIKDFVRSILKRIEMERVLPDVIKEKTFEILQYFVKPLKKFNINIQEIPGDEESIYNHILQISSIDGIYRWFDDFIHAYCLKIQEILDTYYRKEIQDIIQYIECNYHRNISLKSASDMIYMSESHLSRVFKQQTGITFTDFIMSIRMNEASELLKDSNIPIYEISLLVGYENVNYFGRLFKKVTGTTPSGFRGKYHQSDGE